MRCSEDFGKQLNRVNMPKDTNRKFHVAARIMASEPYIVKDIFNMFSELSLDEIVKLIEE
nr:MAG TPA: hypothetical protein [Caudoviricetes sp.]